MLVSVVIVTYQRTDLCKQTVLQLLPMLDPRTELIIVEQGNPTLERFCRELGPAAAKYLYLSRPSTVSARNVGTCESKGDIVLMIDDDVIPLKGLVDAHRSRYSVGNVGAVAGRVLSHPSDLQESFDLPSAARTPEGWELVDFRSDSRGEVYSIFGCNMSFRRDILKQIGGFDPNFRMWREDSDLAFRMWRAGYRVVYEGSAALIHLSAQSGGTRAQKYSKGPVTAELGMYARHYRHYRDNLYFLCRNFSGRRRMPHVIRAYKRYVGISRWPWRLIAKNLCFAAALTQANRLAKQRAAQPLRPLE